MFRISIVINNIKYHINDVVNLITPLNHLGTNEIINKGAIVKIENKYNIFKETKITLYLADGFSDGDVRYTSYLKTFTLKELNNEKK